MAHQRQLHRRCRCQRNGRQRRNRGPPCLGAVEPLEKAAHDQRLRRAVSWEKPTPLSLPVILDVRTERLPGAGLEALLAIINDILDVSKIEAGRLTIERVPFNLQELVTAAMAPAQLQARNKGLLLECSIDAGVG